MGEASGEDTTESQQNRPRPFAARDQAGSPPARHAATGRAADAPSGPRLVARVARPLWFVLGIVALAAGAVGAVLPLVPTTVFLILAAYAFARSSERLHRWLLDHPRFGPPIRDWREHGAIGRRQKVWAVALMAAAFALSVALGVSALILLVQAVVLTAVGVFVLTRPDTPDAR